MQYAELPLLLFLIHQICWHIHEGSRTNTKRAVFALYQFVFKS